MALNLVATVLVSQYLRNGSRPSLISDSANATLSNLKLIGSIREGEKFHVNKKQSKPITWWTALERMYYHETRDLSINFFENTINRTFEIIDAHLTDEKNKIFCCNAVVSLANSVNGLLNSQRTYLLHSDDRDFSTRIHTLIETIQSKLIDYEQKHPDLFMDLTEETENILAIMNIRKKKEKKEENNKEDEEKESKEGEEKDD